MFCLFCLAIVGNSLQSNLNKVGLAQYKAAQQGVQADLVVRAALEPPSRRGAWFRFVGWFSHQAANANRWALRTIGEV